MAYKVNDTILYGAQGICRIAEITERDFGGNFIKYYVLKTVFNDNSTILVPMENEALTAKMRRILSAEEIYDLIQSMPDEELIWIENETARKEQYRAILSNGDREELVRLIKTLYLRQQSQIEKGKKLHLSDERFLKEAEKILYEEFAHVLNIKREQVLPFILAQIDINKKTE